MASAFNGADDQHDGPLAIDSAGNIWFGVSHESSGDYGGGTVLSLGSDDWVLVKLDPDGNHLRTRRIGSTNDDDPRPV